MAKKVVVAMSGGVDSSTAALLMLEQGYIVVGATMKLIDNESSECAIRDAKEVCDKLNIEHYVFDFCLEFRQIVIDNFINSYKEGRTPNPCVVCNKYFKFGLFYKKAKEVLQADFIATGHYVRIDDGLLKRAYNLDKDQSYFLYGIDKSILPSIIFPLGNFKSKDEVRKIANRASLNVFNKKDSQEVCFVPNDDYKQFLLASKDININMGNICLKDGTILGKHSGIINYTIGQRKGLNISYKEPLYVLDLDAFKNEVIVGSNQQLLHKELIAVDTNFLVDDVPLKLYAKIRSRGSLQKVTIKKLENRRVHVYFDICQRAITRGQSVVFYDEFDTCIGGGIIKEVL